MHHKSFIKCIVFLSFLMLPQGILAQRFIIDTTFSSANITPSVSFFLDESSLVDIDQIQEKEFINVSGSSFYFGNSNANVWARFDLRNASAQQDFILELSNSGFDEVDLYYKNKRGNWVHKQNGDTRDLAKKDLKQSLPAFKLKLETGEDKRYYVKFNSAQGLSGTIKLSTPLSFYKAKVVQTDKFSFAQGVVFARLLFHLSLLFLIFGNHKFRAFNFFGIVVGLQYLSGTSNKDWLIGVPAPMLDILGYLPYALIIVSFSNFVYQSFQVKTKFKSWRWVFYFFAASGVVFLLINLFTHDARINKIFEYVNLVMELVFIVFIIHAFRKGVKPSIWYIIPIFLYLVPNFLLMLRLVGIQIPGIVPVFIFIVKTEMLFTFVLIAILLKEAIQDKTKVENALLLRKVEAEKAAELNAAKTDFFTNVSHELKTPLTLISGPADNLIKKYPKEKLLQLMKPNIDRLKDLIGQILEIQRIEAGKQYVKFDNLDIALYLKTHVQSFESLTDSKGMGLTFVQNKDSHLVSIDKDKLEKIIDNLISNAIKYTDTGGQVSVEVTYFDDSVQVRVEDDGRGISARDLPHIFDRFRQVQTDSRQGSGVGLALVKELVTLLRGSIEVDSELNKGSVFTLTLPYTPFTGKLPQITVSDAESEVDEGSSKEILLIVDDNQEMREYLKYILEETYQVITAVDGADGVAKAKRVIPDLIISDLMMPKMDGFEFARHLKSNQESSHVPIIMLTAKSAAESKLESLEWGIDHFLNKPFNEKELFSLIKNTLQNRKRVRENYSQSLVEQKPSGIVVDNAEQAFFNSLKNFLEANYTNSQLGVKDMARHMKMSETQLRRKLKGIVNYSPNGYLRKFRLQKAKFLLRNGEKSVSEIAFEVGYENHSYFSKVFLQEFGFKPSEYE